VSRLPLILSATALVVAVLGSTPLGEAASDAVFPPNSVGTTQLRANAVVSAKIRNGSVTALDIQKRAITAAHVKPGSLVAASFRAGQLPTGPKGDKGDKGDKGVKGDPGLSGYQVVQGPLVTVPPNTYRISRIACPTGKRPIGGGGHSASGIGGIAYLTSSIPIDNREWQASFRNPHTSAISMWAYVVCATVATTP
jgi:hypothetical protein